MPADRTIRIVWPSANPKPATPAVLDGLARRVGYLGRATTPALLSLESDVVDLSPQTAIHEPSATGGTRLRVPYAGYLDRLRDAFAAGESANSVARRASYRSEPELAPTAVKPAHDAVYDDLVVLAFRPGEGIDGRYAPAVARAFKAAVLQRLGRSRPNDDPWPAFDDDRLALLHGHHDGRFRQCAFLALPDVDHRHAGGELLGVAIALSRDLDHEVRRSLLLLAGLDRDDGPRLERVRVPGLGRSLHLEPPDGRTTVTADRWCRPSTRWTSVLPVVLDWFPKRRRSTEDVLADGFRTAGYPDPVTIDVGPPTVSGVPTVPRRMMARRAGSVLPPSVHATFTFDRPVPGPVVIGHLRHIGLGLCLTKRRSG